MEPTEAPLRYRQFTSTGTMADLIKILNEFEGRNSNERVICIEPMILIGANQQQTQGYRVVFERILS